MAAYLIFRSRLDMHRSASLAEGRMSRNILDCSEVAEQRAVAAGVSTKIGILGLTRCGRRGFRTSMRGEPERQSLAGFFMAGFGSGECLPAPVMEILP